jgi:hypothetical protein
MELDDIIFCIKDFRTDIDENRSLMDPRYMFHRLAVKYYKAGAITGRWLTRFYDEEAGKMEPNLVSNPLNNLM